MVDDLIEQIAEFPKNTPPADLTDEQLVTAHLSGLPGAFQCLYDRYRDRLIHFIIRKTGDPDRAQDLVQETFIRVTRHLHRFDTTKKFSTWVYTIASNLSKNELRNRSRSPLVLFQRLTGNWAMTTGLCSLKTIRCGPMTSIGNESCEG